MTIEQHKVVTLNYVLSNHTTGQKIEQTSADSPLVFLYGVGGIIPEFEEQIKGKSVGDRFDFHILAHNAYGLSSEEKIAMIPIDVFHDEQGNFDAAYFSIGATIPMSNSEGDRMIGTIKNVSSEMIEMDFNHPLAGIDLHFSGEILGIREADADEIAHGHVHGEGGHHH
jgi:FKBP-type peptidyl-prolyl cis-trans isomerase SlyD